MITDSEAPRLHKRYKYFRRKADADRLMEYHYGFAVQTARRQVGPHLSYPEALAAALRGLYEALKRYDPDQGSFTTFAYWWMFKSITIERTFSKNVVKIPVPTVRKSRKIQRMREKGFKDTEIAEAVGVSIDDVEMLANLHRHPTGEEMKKDQYIVEERGDPTQDVRRDSEKKMMLDQIKACIAKLPPIQQKIVNDHHAENPKTFRELSEELNLSRQRVRDLYKEAIKRIQHICQK